MAVETAEVDTFTEEIVRIIEEVKDKDFFSETRLRSQKRELLGDYLTSLNSPEYVANQFTKYLFDGIDLYELPELIESITLKEVINFFNSSIDVKNFSKVVVKGHD